MTVEEAIQWFSYRVEDAKKALESYGEDDTAEGFKMVAKIRLESAEMALAALRAQEEAEKNEPLTLKELLEMNGQPVWLNNAPNGWKCFIVSLYPIKDGKVLSDPCGIDLWGSATSLSLLAECGLYRHPPIGIGE